MTKHSSLLRLSCAALVATPAWMLCVPASAATAPTIVSAQMVDVDLDNRVDRIDLTYSEPINHVLDTSGFPFTVGGYTVKRVLAATGTTKLSVDLAELASADITARPAVGYATATSQPVTSAASGLQAAAQTFKTTTMLDADQDGYASSPLDCGPTDATIHPGAVDLPDIPSFTDSNCDGIDGDANVALFVDANKGVDTNPGTKALPVRTMQRAFQMMGSNRTQVLTAQFLAGVPDGGTLQVPDGIGIYGGYTSSWTRTANPNGTNGIHWKTTGTNTLQQIRILGAEGTPFLHVNGGKVLLEDVAIDVGPSDTNATALLVTGNGAVTMEDGMLRAGDAGSQKPADDGYGGSFAFPGKDGSYGDCDGYKGGWGGYGGGQTKDGASARYGGNGGVGGYDDLYSDGTGKKGQAGSGGTLGGLGGKPGNPGLDGEDGADGLDGKDGTNGSVRTGTFGATGYAPATSSSGTNGQDGFGGGGGGGGGGQVGTWVIAGIGAGGGGGGMGGGGGKAGKGGQGGFASIAAYVSTGFLTLHGTKVITGNGGNGGKGGVGGNGAEGAYGGAGGGAEQCPVKWEYGHGGQGGKGGWGGDGGDGADGQAGPSIGVYGGVYSQLDVAGATFQIGSAGTGPMPMRANVYHR